MKKVFVCGFRQESNSFNPLLEELEKFESFGIHEGKEAGKNFEAVRGMYKTLEENNIASVDGVVMRSSSGGPIKSRVAEWFLEKIIKKLKENKVDGVLVALHGATVSDKSEDVCGEIVERIREIVGENVPISASFDLHGNITEKMIKNVDYISGFQAYPHLDQFNTGVRAAKRIVEHLSGNKKKTVCVSIPMIAPAHGYTTETGSLNKLKKRAESLVEKGEICDFTIFQVQPWLDVSEMNSVVVVIDKNEDKAREVAISLAKENFSIRNELLGSPLITVKEVIEKAIKNNTDKPIVLVDSADSPNAGSTGDSAAVIGELISYKDTLSCAVAVTDIPAVEKAFSLGAGAKSDFELGASIAPKITKKVILKDAVIKSLHDGIFYMYGPQEKGYKRNVGKTAILQAGKILVHVSSNGNFEGDLNFYRTFGIEPLECDLVCVKACTSFRAGYEPIAAEICNANTPGAAGVVLTDLPFEKRPVPMYPFEEITEKNISKPKVCRK